MDTIRVGKRGQITLPSRIRRRIGIREGDQIYLVLQGDHLLLHPITKTLLDMRGSVPVSGPQDFSMIRKEVFASRAKRSGSH